MVLSFLNTRENDTCLKLDKCQWSAWRVLECTPGDHSSVCVTTLEQTTHDFDDLCFVTVVEVLDRKREPGLEYFFVYKIFFENLIIKLLGISWYAISSLGECTKHFKIYLQYKLINTSIHVSSHPTYLYLPLNLNVDVSKMLCFEDEPSPGAFKHTPKRMLKLSVRGPQYPCHFWPNLEDHSQVVVRRCGSDKLQ